VPVGFDPIAPLIFVELAETIMLASIKAPTSTSARMSPKRVKVINTITDAKVTCNLTTLCQTTKERSL
jgi:hypothetical protein